MANPSIKFMTKNGIFYTLEDSPYRTTIYNYCFIFSSRLYQRKFINGWADYHKKISKSLTERFGITIAYSSLSLIKYYSSVEKRGFLIYDAESGVWYTCLNQVILNGDKATKRS